VREESLSLIATNEGTARIKLGEHGLRAYFAVRLIQLLSICYIIATKSLKYTLCILCIKATCKNYYSLAQRQIK